MTALQTAAPDRRYMTRRALSTAWPAMAESFFVTLAGMIDTMMVSSLGPEAVAAVSLTQQPKFIGLTLFFGLNVAVSALVARRKGEQRRENAATVFLTALTMSLVFCAVITAVFVVFAPQMMTLAGSNPDTHDDAVTYFRIIMGGTIFNVLTMIINSAQRGSGNTRLSMITNLTSSVVNVIFNYLLIGGNLGFPALGIRGAAIATVLGTVVSTAMAVFSLTRQSSYIRIQHIRVQRLRPHRADAKAIWHLTFNTSLENIAMRIGFLATALIAARLGIDEFAIHNVEMQLLGLGFAFADGMQVAAIALTGEALGAGQKKEARAYGQICQRIGLVISVVLSLLLLVGGRWFTAAFCSMPPEQAPDGAGAAAVAAALGKNLFNRATWPAREAVMIGMGVRVNWFIMVIVMLQISQIIFSACLRAAGDVRYTLAGALISVSFIRTAVTILLVYVFHMGLDGIWFGILSDQLSRFILMGLRFRQGKWVDLRI